MTSVFVESFENLTQDLVNNIPCPPSFLDNLTRDLVYILRVIRLHVHLPLWELDSGSGIHFTMSASPEVQSAKRVSP